MKSDGMNLSSQDKSNMRADKNVTGRDDDEDAIELIEGADQPQFESFIKPQASSLN